VEKKAVKEKKGEKMLEFISYHLARILSVIHWERKGVARRGGQKVDKAAVIKKSRGYVWGGYHQCLLSDPMSVRGANGLKNNIS